MASHIRPYGSGFQEAMNHFDKARSGTANR